MARTYRQLDLDERRSLFRLVEARTPVGEVARGLARKRVTVHEFPDGRLAIRHKGVDLPYQTFDKPRLAAG